MALNSASLFMKRENTSIGVNGVRSKKQQQILFGFFFFSMDKQNDVSK